MQVFLVESEAQVREKRKEGGKNGESERLNVVVTKVCKRKTI